MSQWTANRSYVTYPPKDVEDLMYMAYAATWYSDKKEAIEYLKRAARIATLRHERMRQENAEETETQPAYIGGVEEGPTPEKQR